MGKMSCCSAVPRRSKRWYFKPKVELGYGNVPENTVSVDACILCLFSRSIFFVFEAFQQNNECMPPRRDSNCELIYAAVCAAAIHAIMLHLRYVFCIRRLPLWVPQRVCPPQSVSSSKGARLAHASLVRLPSGAVQLTEALKCNRLDKQRISSKGGGEVECITVRY